LTRKSAQIASCLKASDFEKAFHIVQAAIGGSRRKKTETSESLVPKYTLSPTKATATPRRSPTKTPLRALPSKDSPQKRKLVPAITLDQVDFDTDPFDILVPETPTKRRKAESPSKTTRISPIKPIFPQIPSSSRVTLDAPRGDEMTMIPTPSLPCTPRRSQHKKSTQQMVVADPPMDVDAPKSPLFSGLDEGDDADPPPPPRFRPVYPDHKQWYSRDGRLNRIWTQGETHKQNMVELYGHPLAEFQSQTMDRGQSVVH